MRKGKMLPGIVVRSRGNFLQKAAVQRLTLIKVRREGEAENVILSTCLWQRHKTELTQLPLSFSTAEGPQ